MKRRILSIVTVLALCLSLCPTWALAAEEVPEDAVARWEKSDSSIEYLTQADLRVCIQLVTICVKGYEGEKYGS